MDKSFFSPARVKAILSEKQILPSKSMGQNFLWDRNILEKIVSLIPDNKTCRYIEIGPGLGHLTRVLLERLDNLTIIEKDKRLFNFLKGSIDSPKLSMINDDVLSVNLKNIFDKDERIIIVSNLPYSITSPVIEKLNEIYDNLEYAVFLLQKEVAQRITANHGTRDYGRLSVFCQLAFECISGFTVKPPVFFPVPKIDSKIICLNPEPKYKGRIEPDKLRKVIKSVFHARRKTLFNSLRLSTFIDINDSQISKLFTDLNLDKKIRGEMLCPQEILELAVNLSDNGIV